MTLANALYGTVFRRNYVFVGSVFAGAFAFEMLFDSASDRVWDRLNAGRQWKDIRRRYVTDEE